MTAIPHAPISWGELIDKITILEIKREKITAPAAAANIARELAALEAVAAAVLDTPGLSALTAELKAINAELWVVEDAIRDKDRAGAFDDEFIALARAVYRRNDARGQAKKKINQILNSELVEEKSYREFQGP